MRGEHHSKRLVYFAVEGSSPHARGTLLNGRVNASNGGIIPACAGNTLRPARAHPERRDHPRMRGEHKARAIDHDILFGIIPACAGNTL